MLHFLSHYSFVIVPARRCNWCNLVCLSWRDMIAVLKLHTIFDHLVKCLGVFWLVGLGLLCVKITAHVFLYYFITFSCLKLQSLCWEHRETRRLTCSFLKTSMQIFPEGLLAINNRKNRNWLWVLGSFQLSWYLTAHLIFSMYHKCEF